jgi:hypothetical protein
MVEGRDGGGGCVHIVIYIRIGISLGLERGRKVYFRESENVVIEMTLNQGRLVHGGARFSAGGPYSTGGRCSTGGYCSYEGRCYAEGRCSAGGCCSYGGSCSIGGRCPARN